MEHRASGFTLIETLIALLLLSLGLLAVAGMQLKALQGAHMGYQRSLVTLMAIDAQERAWAGRANGACEAASAISGDWLNHWDNHGGLHLDATNTQLSSGPAQCEYQVTVQWHDGRSGITSMGMHGGGAQLPSENANNFTYTFRLPE